MIRVERVSADWAEAQVEVDKEVISKSTEIWAVWHDEELCAIGGVVKRSFIGTSNVWLAPINLRPALRHCRAILREARRKFGPLVAGVEPGRDQRFAEWCGFRAAGEHDRWVRVELWQ